jgi:hypothetical protein
MKTELNLTKDEFWTIVGHVTIEGDKTAAPFPSDAPQDEGEKIVQSWQKVAVLKVEPAENVMIGYITDKIGHIIFLNQPIQTKDGMFGMRVGDSNVSFFALNQNPKINTDLQLVEVVNVDDQKYTVLPLY